MILYYKCSLICKIPYNYIKWYNLSVSRILMGGSFSIFLILSSLYIYMSMSLIMHLFLLLIYYIFLQHMRILETKM